MTENQNILFNTMARAMLKKPLVPYEVELAFYALIRSGYIPAVEQFIHSYPSNPTTGLLSACEFNDGYMAHFFLEHGADLHIAMILVCTHIADNKYKDENTAEVTIQYMVTMFPDLSVDLCKEALITIAQTMAKHHSSRRYIQHGPQQLAERVTNNRVLFKTLAAAAAGGDPDYLQLLLKGIENGDYIDEEDNIPFPPGAVQLSVDEGRKLKVGHVYKIWQDFYNGGPKFTYILITKKGKRSDSIGVKKYVDAVDALFNDYYGMYESDNVYGTGSRHNRVFIVPERTSIC